MKIALVIERMEAWRGGAETSTLQYAQSLKDAGCEVHLVTASRGQPPAGITLNMLPGSNFNRAWATYSFHQKARKLILADNFDVVHAVAPFAGANLYQPRSGTVVETIERNLALCPPGKRPWKRLFNRLNTRQQLLLRLEQKMLTANPGPVVVAISDYVTRQLTEHYHLPASRIRQVFNAVDTTLLTLPEAEKKANRQAIRTLYHLADHEVVLLCVAHNFKLKGVAPLLTAVGQILSAQPQLPLKLLIIGRDNPVPHLQHAERLGIAERVQFVGSTERMPAFYHASDVLVHPTYYDPCSRVVLEALAAGLPCITTRHNGAGEIMGNGRGGLVISDADCIPELAEAIGRMTDVLFRKNCSVSAGALAETLSMTRHVSEMLEVYQELHKNGPTVQDVCRGFGFSV